MNLLKDNREKNWFWLENDVLERTDLTIYEKMVYIVLARYADDESKCFPSIKTIASKASCSDRQVRNVLTTLEEKNLIKKQQRKISGKKEFDSNLYYINSVKINEVMNDIPNPTECDSEQVGNDIPNPTECDSEQVRNEVPSKKTYIKKSNIKRVYMDLSFLDMDIENVKITQEEYNKLVKKYGADYIANQILNLENYIVNGKGDKYKSHYKVLLTWGNMDLKKGNLVITQDKNNFFRKPQNSNNYPQSYPNYQQDGYNPNQLDLDY